jgi:hypothetical protein
MDEEECLDASGKVVFDAPEPCPGVGGVLLTDHLAARFQLYRLSNSELRKIVQADFLEWKAQRALYEKRLEDADKAIYNLQPGWWDRNAFSVGTLGGMVLGVGMAVSMFSLLN